MFANIFSMKRVSTMHPSRQMHPSSPYREAWTVQKSVDKGRDRDERTTKKEKVKKGAWLRTAPRRRFSTTVRRLWRGGQSWGISNTNTRRGRQRPPESRWSCSVDVLATLSATSYVSFPFHFQSEESRNQKPRIFLAAGANKATYAPLLPLPSPSVCQMLRRDKLGELLR